MRNKISIFWLVLVLLFIPLTYGCGGGGGSGSGDGSGGGAPPPLLQYTLTVNTEGQGTVALDPAGGTYNENTVVTLTATADTGWRFSEWSSDLSGSDNPTTITMNSDKTVTARFIQTYTMTEYFPLTSSWETDKWTLVIVGEREINGVMTKAMMDTRYASVAYLTNDENGLRAHGHMDNDGSVYESSTPIVFADSAVAVGDKKESTFTEDGEESKAVSELVGLEDISVPAGHFEGCLKFEVTLYGITAGTEDLHFKETWWLAKGVGLVKAVNDGNSGGSIFADNGETRQLLSYYITPDEVTPDQQAIGDDLGKFEEYYKAEDLDEMMILFSDDYLNSCTDKDAVRTYFEDLFANNRENSNLSSSSIEFVVTGDLAYYVRERLRTGVDEGTDQRWWNWDRSIIYCKNEGGEWKIYGNDFDFRPSWQHVFLRNAPEGKYLSIAAGISDCVGNTIDANADIASLTITGPPGTSIDPDLKKDWFPDYLEYFRSEDIANATNGFYTFTLTTNDGRVNQFTDYLQVMELLDIANLVYPIGGITVPAGDVTLDWDDVDQVHYYRVDLQYYDAGTWRYEAQLYLGQSEQTINLPGGMDWRWRIRARQDDIYGELDNESRTYWEYFSTS